MQSIVYLPTVNGDIMFRAAKLVMACVIAGPVFAACQDNSNASKSGTNSVPAIGTDAGLADLYVSAGEFDQIFQPVVHNYTASTTYLGAATTVAATPIDPDAVISINGTTFAAGAASHTILLEEGSNQITVTVTAEDGITTDSYSVHITRSGANDLLQRAYIKASNTDSDDNFGAAVALSGDLLAIGAPGEDSAAVGVNGDQSTNGAANSGAVYVFHKDKTGMWRQEAYLKAANSDTGDQFGHSIALSGDILAIGAIHEDGSDGIDGNQANNAAIDAGAVFIFVRDITGLWSQQAYIKASNAEPFDNFGGSVALDGNTLVVGAHLEDSGAADINGNETNNSSPNAGAAYVYVRDEVGIWTQQAYLKASNSDSGDQFAKAIALSQNTLAVGAPNEASKAAGIDGNPTNNSWPGTGAVYVFRRDDAGSWAQQAYIKASNPGAGDLFGAAISLSDNTLAVGAPREDSAAIGIDSIQSDNKALNAGAVYLFSRDGSGAWSQVHYLKASNTDSQDQFGDSVAVHSGFLGIGAIDESSAASIGGDQTDNSAAKAGAVYLFTRDDVVGWSQTSYLKAENADTGDVFGTAVAIGDYEILIGADLEDSAATGIGGNATDNSSLNSGAAYLID